jgi:type VI secretion system protein ImpK
MTAVATERPRGGGSDAPRRGLLALSLQEPFTTIARLRANRQVAADSESFRTRIKQVLSGAEQEGRQAGYAADDIRLALFAVIAFLDETVLNSGQAMFADWPRRPLQQEVFGVHMAGELFFQYLQQLLGRQDSEDLADVLEVYELCLLLGYKGRYSASHGAELQVLAGQVSQKIDRVHGGMGELSPEWRPSSTEIAQPRDVWVPRLIATAATAGIIAVVLFIAFAISLHSGKSDLAALASQLVR